MRFSQYAFAAGASLAILEVPFFAFAAEEDEVEEEGEEEEQDFWAFTPQQLTALFSKVDKNSDGKVSLEELAAFGEATSHEIFKKDAKESFKETDTSNDGKVALEEYLPSTGGDGSEDYKKYVEQEKLLFAAADKNKDGFLDEQEYHALQKPDPHHDVKALRVKEILSGKDENEDGKLSLKEFSGYSQHEGPDEDWDKDEKEHFATLDTNKDGFLDANELKHYEEGGDVHMKLILRRFVQKEDEDGDGQLSAKEFETAMDEGDGEEDDGRHSEVHAHIEMWVRHHEL